MTEEIKEILDRLQDSVNYPKIDMPTSDGSDSECIGNDTLLEPSKCKLLLNYITNLQKENEELLKKLEDISLDEANIRADILLEQQDYKQRNEKAVEYIENHSRFEPPYYEMREFNNKANLNELYNILQGGDE